jgi:triacylglycerol esterase/lipase EstA (alpha/beta hydrolase family)
VFGKSDINLIGISQGNMVARWIIEACDLGAHKVHNYLSISGPQQGVQAVPECLTGDWCKALNLVAD